ncbi:2Fe-2S iron-sulfur cluster-binding protein [Pseudochryseolinea flava]|uniref:Ferredoxin n=1 Tax=Pseudochryseolinea flava TaxID=2059302 RepID=A0A364Y6R4_9BACT|nr:2Fe-2S iron-sulfur cluster-binding protein [Pseudochryseolinea flava]RAW02796.1 ferredoxin [Pseudochryseolinea flava]
MASILIENLDQRKVEAIDLSRPVLKHLQDQQIDWMFACGGKGRCTTCKFELCSDAQALEPDSEAETRYRRQGALKKNERLACQAKLTGDIRIRVPDECKLPHMHYSDE